LPKTTRQENGRAIARGFDARVPARVLDRAGVCVARARQIRAAACARLTPASWQASKRAIFAGIERTRPPADLARAPARGLPAPACDAREPASRRRG